MARKPPKDDKKAIETMPRFAFKPAGEDKFEAFIEHVEYFPGEGPSPWIMPEHVWATRRIGIVSAAGKRKMEARMRS